MKGSRRSILLLATCLLAVLGVAVALAGPDSRGPVKNWRAEFAAFLERPAETQERIRRLDRELQEADPESQVVLYRVMQRYVDWLERLPPEQRREIEQANSTQEKLRHIRAIREEQWMATLPKADRDHINGSKTPDERRKRIAAAREAEYSRQMDWLFTQAGVGQASEKLGEEIRKLRLALDQNKQSPLTSEELQQLRALQGTGPAYLRLMVELGKKHDVPVSPAFRRMWAEQEANPPVNKQKLLHFFTTRLSESERKLFDARFRDPEQQEQARKDLEKRYWQDNPEELARVRESARKKRDKPRPMKPVTGEP